MKDREASVLLAMSSQFHMHPWDVERLTYWQFLGYEQVIQQAEAEARIEKLRQMRGGSGG